METLAHRSLVALTPQDVPGAQRGIAEWCRAKLIALGRELREQRQNLRQAKSMKWKHSGWVNAATKTKRQMIYYAKIKAAVDAGYLVVPNFDVDVIAVRVAVESSPKDETDVTVATPGLLPQNQGRYVDDALIGHDEKREVTRADKSTYTVTDFHPTGYDREIDFPVSLVKPVVLEATERAMSLRIFDRIGIARGGRKSDPIVLGQIINPKTRAAYGGLRSNPICVSFFVAWWLNTEDL